MKKITLLLTTLLLVFTFAGCKETTDPDDFVLCEEYPTHIDCIQDPEPLDCPEGQHEEAGACVLDTVDPIDPVDTDKDFLDIFYLNDFHGAILENDDDMGLAKIGNYINYYTEENPDNTIVLAGGDMLQGSALSNYYQGLSTINLLDEIGFDAFALGNHEFDWGLDVVTQYFDEDETNGEADFPLLAANVFYEGTTTIPDHIDPYTIIEKGDLKIGVIGSIGHTLESSIATSKVEDYEFVYAVPLIEQYATQLRTVDECDIVIWVGHDTGSINDELLNLSGNAKLDALFNGHSHSEYADSTESIPQMQSGSTGEYVGHVRLNLNDYNQVTSYTAENVNASDDINLWYEYQPVQDIIDVYVAETDPIFGVPIITAGEGMSQSSLSLWLAKLMVHKTGAVIAFQNSGGTRSDISENETVTYATLYEVWPFDNVIKTVYLDGAIINNLKAINLPYYTTETEFLPGTLYKVATNDYVFDKTDYPFIDGDTPTNTEIILRDLVEDELLLQTEIYAKFYLDNEIQSIFE